jgi:hypothetical protein
MRARWTSQFRLALAALFGLALAACQAEAPPTRSEDAGAASPAPMEQPAAEVPSEAGAGDSSPAAPPAPPSPTDTAEGERDGTWSETPEIGAGNPSIRGRIGDTDGSGDQGFAPAPPMPGDGPSGVAVDRVMTPVLVELLGTEARQPRQGGSAVVLLAWSGAAIDGRRNLALCRELFLRFDQATTGEVGVGVRRGAEGETQLLRPLYWPTRQGLGPTTGADRCAQRLEQYDFPRAERIRRKFGLSGAGPYLVVERADMSSTERVAAVIDLSRARPEQISGIVSYFRDSFMQSATVWDRNRFNASRTRDEMRQSLGADVAASILPRLVVTTRNVGCALTSLIDVCDASAPAQ